MATFTTGTWTGTYSSSTRTFRGYFVYTITETNTDYTITVTEYGVEKVSSGATTFEGSTSTVSLSGSVTASTTKSFSSKNKIDFGSGANSQAAFWTGSNAVTINKTTSLQTASIKLTASKASGAWKGSATATLTLDNISALPTYTISYDANDGEGSITEQSKIYGQDITLATANSGITRNGYSLTKWNTAEDGSGTDYDLGATYSGNANLTLYAVWSANYRKPTISNYDAYRTTSSGDTFDPNGTYVYIKFDYTGGTSDGGVSYIAPRCTIKVNGIPKLDTTLSTEGSESYRYGTYALTDTANIEVKLWNTNDTEGTTQTSQVSAATFPIALLGDGTAMGIMTPAERGVNLKLPSGTKVAGNLQTTQINGVTVGSSPKFTDTTYSSLSPAENGTDVSLCTTGEKYAWSQGGSVVEWTNQITTGLSGLTVVKAVKIGHLCQIEFNWTKSTAVSGGANAFSTTLTTLPYKPAADVQGCGYYGGSTFVAWLTTAGLLTVRNASSTSRTPSSSGGLYFSVTYICA